MTQRGIRVRVAGLVREEERILLVQHHKAGRVYWLLPGGGVEVGETLADAVRREVEEEVGLVVDVGDLLLLCETIEPRGRHLLHLVFAVTRIAGSVRAGRDGRLVAARWHPVSQLASLRLLPPVAGTLQGIVAGETPVPAVLGNVWTVME